jgi:cyanate permease
LQFWQKIWLLFAVIWGVVAALNAGTILAFSEQPEKALRPILLGLAVPAAAYLLAWLWDRWRRRSRRQGDDQLL